MSMRGLSRLKGDFLPEEGKTFCVFLEEDEEGELVVDRPEPRGRGIRIIKGKELLETIPPENSVEIEILTTTLSGDTAEIISPECQFQDPTKSDAKERRVATDPDSERKTEKKKLLRGHL